RPGIGYREGNRPDKIKMQDLSLYPHQVIDYYIVVSALASANVEFEFGYIARQKVLQYLYFGAQCRRVKDAPAGFLLKMKLLHRSAQLSCFYVAYGSDNAFYFVVHVF